MSDHCAVCGKPDCAFPARERDGVPVFDFGGGSTNLTEKQVEMLKSDHAYNQRHGQLGTRPIAEKPTSLAPPQRDWLFHTGMWLVLALVLALAWFGIGCAGVPDKPTRLQTALQLLTCVEEALPPEGSGVVNSAPPAAAPRIVVDGGAPVRRGIDETDPWWEPDASDARVEIMQPGEQ